MAPVRGKAEAGGRDPRRLVGIGIAFVGIVLVAAAILAAIRPLPSAAELAGSDATKKGFLEAQAADARAHAQGDPGAVRGYLSGAELLHFQDSLRQEALQGVLVEEDIRPTSIELDHQPDPADANFTTRVDEKGFITLTLLSATTHQVTSTSIRRFESEAWMTSDQGKWLIVDEHDSGTPASSMDEWRATRGVPSIPLAAIGALLVLGGGVTAVVSRRRHRELPAPAVTPPPEPVPSPAPADTAPAHDLEIRTFGGLQLLAAGSDLSSEIAARPVAGFIWLYLLLREIEHPGGRISRSELADEVFPGYPPEAQRGKLRDRLSHMRRELPDQLGKRVVLEGDTARLDLTGVRLDVADLRRLVGPQRTPGWLDEAQRVLTETRGPFFPDWEAAARVTEGRGSSLERVGALTEVLSSLRVDLIRELGRNLLERGESEVAVSWLDEGVDARPDREDIGRLLIQALAESGQHARADAMRQEYSRG